jgi:BlaI family penicillinase repressor
MKQVLGSRESEVMDVLWDRGPSTVTEVLAGIRAKLAYTTVLTILRNLEVKGCVEHVAEGRAHRYVAVIDQSAIRRRAVKHLADQLFRGSLDLLLAQLVDDRKLSKDQVQRIQSVLDEASTRKKKK